MTRRQDSIEVSYGWVIVIASLALQSISPGAPNILFVALKPIAADIGSLRTVPSFACSLMMIGFDTIGGRPSQSTLQISQFDRAAVWPESRISRQPSKPLYAAPLRIRLALYASSVLCSFWLGIGSR